MTDATDCRTTRGLLDAFVDRELGLERSLAVEAHLRACPSCLAAAAEIERMQRAVREGARYTAAPAALARQFATRSRARPRRALLATAGAGVAALLALVIAAPLAPLVGARAERVVYHVNAGDRLGTVLRNVANHLDASPNARIVVVAHNDGIGLLLQDAHDADGTPYEPQIAALKARGVDFRACGTTLALRRIDPGRVVREATTVPSGIAEISRLQARHGYAYVRI